LGNVITFFTSCGDVFVTPKKFMYSWCDVNLEGVEDDDIVNEKVFLSKFVFHHFHSSFFDFN